MENKTTITISKELWKVLNMNRTKPDESIEDIIWGFIRYDKKEDREDVNKEDDAVVKE
jgi:hypothetical protein